MTTHISADIQRIIKCVVHDDLGWKNQTTRYILLRHWLYEWFSQFHSCGTYSVLLELRHLLLRQNPERFDSLVPAYSVVMGCHHRSTVVVLGHIFQTLNCYRAGAESPEEKSDDGGSAAPPAANPISRLQELVQKRRWPPPVYEFTDEFGPLHARSHICTIHLLEKCMQGE